MARTIAKTKNTIYRKIKRLMGEKYSGGISFRALRDTLRLLRGEPFEYVASRTSFCSCIIDLSLKPHIPRSGTESWVRDAMETLKIEGRSRPRCLDIFSGSGCVGIAVLKQVPDATMDFIDIDETFLKQITINLKLNGIEENRATLIQSDLFKNVHAQYDYIFANPPYVPRGIKGRVAKEIFDYEPHHTFFAGTDGLELIRPFLSSVREHLNPGGTLWMEYDVSQRNAIEDMLVAEGYTEFNFINHEADERYLVLADIAK